jgi:hypothetical protein
MTGGFRDLSAALGADLSGLGFAPRGRDEFVRYHGTIMQRLAVSLREVETDLAGYVEVFPGFNIPELEALAASLQGKKPRPGFITCSMNIGLLTSKGALLEWPLRAGDDIAPLARLMANVVRESAVPFWNEFLSLDKLLAAFESGDFRVCRGGEWQWRQVAACCLLGRKSQARDLLQRRLLTAAPALKPVIESALRKIEHAES